MNNDIRGFAFGDTETTGVSFTLTDVIEVSFIMEDVNGRRLGDFETKINLPETFVWSHEAEKVHGINMSTAKTHGISQSDACEMMMHAFKKAYGTEYNKVRLVGANSYFDYVMLQNMFEKNGRERLPFSHRVIDVNQMGFLLGKGTKLDDLIENYNIEVDESIRHTALHDAYLHMEVFHALKEDAQNRGLIF